MFLVPVTIVQCRNQGSGLKPEAMVVSQVHAAAMTMQNWVSCRATQGFDDTRTWGAVWGHIWVHGPVVVMLCVDIHSFWDNQRLGRSSRSGPPAGLMLLSKGHLVPGITGVNNQGNFSLRDMCSHLGPWWHPGSGCFEGPCLGLCFYHNLAMMSMAHIATKDHKNQPLPSHPYLWTTIYGHVRQVTARTMPTSAAYSATWGHGVVQVQTAAESHIWVCVSIAVKTCIDVHTPGYHQRQHRCPGLGPSPGKLVSPLIGELVPYTWESLPHSSPWTTES